MPMKKKIYVKSLKEYEEIKNFRKTSIVPHLSRK